MKTISTIIPSYNSREYIKHCVDSVLDQTIKSFEVIVVDDGSTDKTKEILTEYISQNKITYIKKENKGPASARNLGIKNANGDYIAFLDADDIWEKTKLQKQLQISENENTDVIHTGRYFIGEEKLEKASEKLNTEDKLINLIKNNFIINSSVFIKTEIAKKFSFDEDPNMFAVEDYFLWLNLKSVGYKFKYINEPLVGYRIHDKQISSTALENTTKLYFKIFKSGLIGKISLYCRITALYKFIKLSLYKFKIKK